MKESHLTKLSLTFVMTLALLALTPVCPCYAATIPDAQFIGGVDISAMNAGPTLSHAGLNNSGSVSADYNALGLSGHGSVSMSDGSLPMADAMGQCSLTDTAAQGVITYYLQAVRKYPDSPYQVRLKISSTYSVDTTGHSLNYAEAYSYFGTQANPRQDQIVWGLVNSATHHAEGKRTITEIVGADLIFAIYMVAQGRAVQYGDFQAIIDPAVQFDPEWLVDYNGQSVPGADLFSLNFSEGFSAVPIPAAVWLLGAGLLTLAGLRRFRRM